MRRPLRIALLRGSLPLAVAALLLATPAYPAGFQINSQGARAMGMGLAFTAVANDPSAIFFNPAGLGWQTHFEAMVGGSLLTKVKGDFEGENPYPGVNNREVEHKTSFLLPTLYAVVPLTSEINFGLGIFSQYGLGFRWDNAETFSGRFIAQNAVIQSSDINPVLSFHPIPAVAVAVGADYRLSKVQLERNQSAINPFTNSAVDIAHVKLNSELTDNHGWGWNAGILVRPIPQLSVGASYRSKIKIDYKGTSTFEQRLTGNAQFDGLIATRLPQGSHPVKTQIEFPSSFNLGAAVTLPGQLTVSADADWTEWSRFKQLNVFFTDLPGGTVCSQAGGGALCRANNWKDSWAYRVGLEKKFGKTALRAGYYRDKTPQPVENVGPILADSDRDAFSLGLGYDTDRWGVDVSDLYLKFKSLDTAGRSQDNFFGRYHESANVFAISLRVSF